MTPPQGMLDTEVEDLGYRGMHVQRGGRDPATDSRARSIATS